MNDKIQSLLNNSSSEVDEIKGVLSLESKIRYSDKMISSEYEYKVLI